MKRLSKKILQAFGENEALWGLSRKTWILAAKYAEGRHWAKERGDRAQREIDKHMADYRVKHGPFKGLQYPRLKNVTETNLFCKLLGCYESETHNAINDLVTRGYSQIINIGCAEGYYTVGMALRCPEAKIFAYDINQDVLSQCKEMARLNGVLDRVTWGSFVDKDVLRKFPFEGRALIICDCEGYESELFDRDLVDVLAGHDVFVEVHDGLDITISDNIKSSYAATHDILHIFESTNYERFHNYDYPELKSIPAQERFSLISEDRRDSNGWLILRSTRT